MTNYESRKNLEDTALVVFTGPPNGGVSTIVRNWSSLEDFSSLDFNHPEIGDHFSETRVYGTRSLLYESGWKLPDDIELNSPEHRKNLQEFHYFARQSGQANEIWDHVQFKPHTITIIDQVRNPLDAQYLKKCGAVIVRVLCDIDTARERFILHQEDDKHPGESESEVRQTVWDLIFKEYAPKHPNDPHASDIKAVMEMADYEIDGNSYFQPMLDQSYKVLSSIALSHISIA